MIAPILLTVALSGAPGAYCTIDDARYYRCLSLAELNINGSPGKVYVERAWFAAHCRATGRGDRNVGVYARCDDWAPAVAEGLPMSALARAPESFRGKMKRRFLYVVGAVVTAIYFYGRAQ